MKGHGNDTLVRGQSDVSRDSYSAVVTSSAFVLSIDKSQFMHGSSHEKLEFPPML
jgi:hypothetical protein